MKPSMPCEWARGAWNRSLSGSLLQRKSMEIDERRAYDKKNIPRSEAIWGIESPAGVKKLGNPFQLCWPGFVSLSIHV